MNPIYTVGHSNHSEAVFLDLLRAEKIDASADVRSAPYSRYNAQFDREHLTDSLGAAGIQYAFLGKELGARSDDPGCSLYGKIQYDKLAETELFRQGIARVMEASRDRSVALLCAEKEPLDCHRTILVARHLVAAGAEVRHLHADGHVEPHADAVGRPLQLLRLRPDLFRTEEQLIEDAYGLQAAKIAYDSADDASAA